MTGGRGAGRSDAASAVQGEWRIEVERDQRAAAVRVDAPAVTTPDLAHLADLLDWLLSAGSTDVRVDLGALANVDAALLEVLRGARDRLDGHLTATAGRADARRTLFLMGLNQATSSASEGPAQTAPPTA